MSGALSLRGRNEKIEVVNRAQIKQKFLIRVKELAFFFLPPGVRQEARGHFLQRSDLLHFGCSMQNGL